MIGGLAQSALHETPRRSRLRARSVAALARRAAPALIEAWPLFHAEKLEPSGGLKADGFGTITREDGKKQTTYGGMPLYYWMKDAKPGDTTGHGVKDVWFVAKP